MLEVSDLEVRYGKVRAVRGISLDVPAGASVAILGPNGAGKTSLLRALAGAVKPAAGTVRWNGEDVTGWPAYKAVRSGFAHVPEGRDVIAPLSVLDNLKMGGYTTPKSEIPDLIDHMLEMFPALKRRLRTSSGKLSGGEQQMLAIARGLMSKPSLIAIDEPSMGLAPAIADAVLDGLRLVNQTGAAVLLVEQNAALALDIAKTVILLSRGEVSHAGPAAELRDDVLASYAQ